MSSLAKFGPSSVVTLIVMGGWKRYKDRPWRQVIQRGLVPVTVGLVVSSGLLIAKASATTLSLAGVIALCTLLALNNGSTSYGYWRSARYWEWCLADNI